VTRDGGGQRPLRARICRGRGRRRQWRKSAPAVAAAAAHLCHGGNSGSNLSGRSTLLGGPAQNLSNFQMAPIPILSVLTCSTSSPHDILKVSRKIIDHNLPVGWDKCNKWVLGGINCRIYVGFLLVGGELSLMANFFIQYIPLLMIVICWWIGGIEWSKVSWKKSIGKCLFSVKKSFSTYFFHCILPVPTPQYTIILLLLPNIMLRCCWYTCTESIWHHYMWKNPLGLSCLLDFCYFSTHFWHFSMYSSHFYPAMLFYSCYTPLLITLSMQ
jgi:hypothetical protein